MSAVGRRSLHDLVEREAPIPAARATAIAVAIARHLERVEAGGLDAGAVDSTRVTLAADGSVAITGEGGAARPDEEAVADGPPIGSEGGASIGRLLFELLTGRPPLGRDDAYEPAVTAALSSDVCALLARSFSDAPGQWPDAGTWRRALEDHSGGLAPPVPPRQAAAARAKRIAVVVGFVALAVATLVILLLAPGWWDDADDGSLAPPTGAHAEPAPARQWGPVSGPHRLAGAQRTSS